jgi:hypothetical protein
MLVCSSPTSLQFLEKLLGFMLPQLGGAYAVLLSANRLLSHKLPLLLLLALQLLHLLLDAHSCSRRTEGRGNAMRETGNKEEKHMRMRNVIHTL